jgi:nucleotide-binding universal stress UspA family protein
LATVHITPTQTPELSANIAGPGRAGVASVVGDDVPEGIRLAAIEESADLVIVGRGHHRGAVSRLWSDLYRIVRESPCPVLSV